MSFLRWIIPLSGDRITLIKQKLNHIPTSYPHPFPFTAQRWKSKLFPAGPCAFWPPGNPSALMTSSYHDPFTAWTWLHWPFLSFWNLLRSSLPQGLCTYCFFCLEHLFLGFAHGWPLLSFRLQLNVTSSERPSLITFIFIPHYSMFLHIVYFFPGANLNL